MKGIKALFVNFRIPLIIIGVLFLTFTVWFYIKHPLNTRLLINGHIITVELAVTPQEKERGLGRRKTLAPDHGMLFLNDHKETYNFWMKDMQFPLDFIWISDKTIVDITQNVQPPPIAPLQAIEPKIPVDKILEVNAGTVEKLGVKIGDVIQILN